MEVDFLFKYSGHQKMRKKKIRKRFLGTIFHFNLAKIFDVKKHY